MRFLIPLLLFAAFCLAIWFLTRRKNSVVQPPAVRVEFWVYCTAEGRPSDKEIMARLHATSPLGAPEGMTLSDVRFHIGVAKRARNALLFRPEALCEADSAIPAGIADTLAEADTIYIVRFVSQGPEPKMGYLSFATYVAKTLAEMTSAQMIWDTEAQRFFVADELAQMLVDNADALRLDLQVGVRWTETTEEGRAFTRGMAKKGLPDVEFPSQPLDQRTLAMFLVEGVARQWWSAGETGVCELEDFGEVFDVEFGEPVPGAPTHRGWMSTLRAVRKRRVSA